MKKKRWMTPRLSVLDIKSNTLNGLGFGPDGMGMES